MKKKIRNKTFAKFKIDIVVEICEVVNIVIVERVPSWWKVFHVSLSDILQIMYIPKERTRSGRKLNVYGPPQKHTNQLDQFVMKIPEMWILWLAYKITNRKRIAKLEVNITLPSSFFLSFSSKELQILCWTHSRQRGPLIGCARLSHQVAYTCLIGLCVPLVTRTRLSHWVAHTWLSH